MDIVVRNALKLTLTNETVVEADHLVSLTGYRPNADLYRELHVQVRTRVTSR